MRTFCITVLMTAFALTGCAATEERATASASSYNDSVDYQRVAVVDTRARQRGVKVIWVNMPKKKSVIATRD